MIRLAVFTGYKLFYFVTTLIELITNSLKAKSKKNPVSFFKRSCLKVYFRVELELFQYLAKYLSFITIKTLLQHGKRTT